MMPLHRYRLNWPSDSTTWRRIPELAIVATLIMLSACEQPDSRSNDNEHQLPTIVPRSIANLTRSGQLQLRFMVNDVQVHDGLWEQNFTGVLQVDASLVQDDVNEINIVFSLLTTARSQPFLLATASHLLPAIQDGATVTFPAIVYQYADNDNDGRYNVHELTEVNSDADEDGVLNVNDADSDNDGIRDGMDATPYGETTLTENTGLQRRFDAMLPDGTSQPLSIDHLNGDADELVHLVDTLGSITLNSPTGWPTALNDLNLPAFETPASDAPDTSDLSGGWTAFTLGNRERQICPAWRLSFDATSIVNGSTQTVLLYFRREGQLPQLIPLDATSVADLDIYNHAPPFDGDGPLNNSLRMILVPRSTLGWIELWTDRELSGSACGINLGTW